MARTWTMTDAWVFAAISHDQPPAAHRLTEIIAIADGVNHDVVTEDEFTKSVGRLIAAGVIDADAQRDRYWPTYAGTDLRKRWKHVAFGWITVIPTQLDRFGEPQDVAWSLPAGVFRSAVDEYLARAAKWTKRQGAKSTPGRALRPPS
jgi:hypothetical protein